MLLRRQGAGLGRFCGAAARPRTPHPRALLSTAAAARPQVFYDGQCPLCAREIAHYQRLNESLPEPAVDFHNIAGEGPLPPALEVRGISRDAALRRMHVLSADGEMVRNAEAFVEFWARMPYWRWLVPLTKVPGVMPTANAAYSWFAERRLKLREAMPAEVPCAIPEEGKGRAEAGDPKRSGS